MSVAEAIDPLAEALAGASDDQLVETLRARDKLKDVLAANLGDLPTTLLVGEMVDRENESLVEEFVAERWPDDIPFDGDLTIIDTKEMVDELAARAAAGDVDALDADDFTRIAEPEGVGPHSFADGMITMPAARLAYALAAVGLVVERRSTIPIIATVLIEAGNDMLSFTGTDLDSEIKVDWITPSTSAPLRVCVANPHELIGVLTFLPREAPVRLWYDGETKLMHVAWDVGSLTLHTQPVEDFPLFVPRPHADESGTLVAPSFTYWAGGDASDLVDALDRSAPCISDEETRYYLNGVCFNQDRGYPCITTTDGHRLITIPTLAGGDICAKRAILPKRSVANVRRLFHGQTFNVSAYGSPGDKPSRMMFAAQGLTLRTKLIDGDFPQWNQVVKSSTPEYSVRLNRRALLEAVWRVLPMAPERSKSVRLKVRNGRFIVSADNQDVGVIEADAGPAERFLGEDLGINGCYLQAALKQVTTEEVELATASIGAPVHFRGVGAPEGEIILLMPLRV